MRVAVRKTPKLFINGAFVRSESGRTSSFELDGVALNVARASKKDLRDSVRAARAAVAFWSEKTAYNRGQILYRLAEMIESRESEFEVGEKEFRAAIDRIVWYAGWCDKIEQFLSSKNPVAGPHFNVSAPEPMGVVGVLAPRESPFLGLISAAIPPLCGGDAVIAVASDKDPMPALAFAEAVATSDVTAGAFNLLTGERAELAQHLARHMDVNAISVWDPTAQLRTTVQTLAAENVKRTDLHDEPNAAHWFSPAAQNPRRIATFMEIKTVWHPQGF